MDLFRWRVLILLITWLRDALIGIINAFDRRRRRRRRNGWCVDSWKEQSAAAPPHTMRTNAHVRRNYRPFVRLMSGRSHLRIITSIIRLSIRLVTLSVGRRRLITRSAFLPDFKGRLGRPDAVSACSNSSSSWRVSSTPLSRVPSVSVAVSLVTQLWPRADVLHRRGGTAAASALSRWGKKEANKLYL